MHLKRIIAALSEEVCVSTHPGHPIRAVSTYPISFLLCRIPSPSPASQILSTLQGQLLYNLPPNPILPSKEIILSLTSQGTYCLYQLVPNVCHLIICSINFSANKRLGLCLDCKFLKGRRENSSPSLYCGPPSQGALSIALYICENSVNILGITECMNKSISAAEGAWSEKTDDKKQEWFNTLRGLWTDRDSWLRVRDPMSSSDPLYLNMLRWEVAFKWLWGRRGLSLELWKYKHSLQGGEITKWMD